MRKGSGRISMQLSKFSMFSTQKDAFLSASSKGSIAYFNGEWRPHAECTVSIEDQSFRYGYGAFDTLRTFDGKLFRPQAHMDRFQQTLNAVGLPQPFTDKQWIDIMQECVERNHEIRNSDEWGGDHWVSIRQTPSTTIVEAQPIPFRTRAKVFKNGAKVTVPSIRRTPPECLPPRAKLHQYVNQILGDLEVKASDPDAWSVMLDTRGFVAEGKSYNFFIVTKDGVLKTARPQYVLEGVARKTILECAKELGIETQECDYDMYDMYQASEAFITATSLCALPVSSINGRSLGDSMPGPITRKLQLAYSKKAGVEDFVQQYLRYI